MGEAFLQPSFPKGGPSLAPRLSIVLYVSNFAQVLDACLDSIFSQSMQDIEVVCVDDASSDGSREILNARRISDGRIQVLETGGVGRTLARGIGLTASRGEYVVFLEGNCLYEGDVFEGVYQNAVSTDADIVLVGGVRLNKNDRTVVEQTDFLRKNVIPDSATFSSRDVPNYILQIAATTLRTKFFKRAFLECEKISFDSRDDRESWLFVSCAMAAAHRISLSDKTISIVKLVSDGYLEEPQAGADKGSDLVGALFVLREFLAEKRLLSLVNLSFVRFALSLIRFRLCSDGFVWQWKQILDSLTDSRFEELELLGRGKDGYLGPWGYDDAVFVDKAKAQYARELKAMVGLDPKILSAVEGGAKNPQVSIVVPVFNSMPYLKETLGSLEEIVDSGIAEVILVNDGSSDGSLDVCLEWCASNRGVMVVSQTNGGLSAARNEGLKHARGHYVCFVDSDDKLSADLLLPLVARACSDDLDMLLYDAETFYETDDLAVEYEQYANYYKRSKDHPTMRSGLAMLSDLVAEGGYLPSACLYLVKREFLDAEGLAFIRGILHEDNAFTFACFLSAKRVAHLRVPVYQRRVRTGSIVTSGKTFARCYGVFRCALDMERRYWLRIGDFSEPERRAAAELFSALFESARSSYHLMEKEERYCRYGLMEYREDFDCRVSDPVDKILEIEELRTRVDEAIHTIAQQREEIARQRETVEDLRVVLDGIKKSTSFRFGSACAAPWRMLRSAVKHENA